MATNDEYDSSPGFRRSDVGAGFGGGDEEPTLVIVPRIPRPTISKGVRLLATAFGELRKSLHEFTDLFDQATALGAIEMTQAEAQEIDDFLADAKRRINGVRSSLRRATTPPRGNATKESP